MPSALTFDRVSKRYGATTAVDALSFDIGRGEMFGLIGPDGAGKTTTIRLLCGLLTGDAGSIRVLGHDPALEHRQVTHSVGYLSQRFSLYGDLSIDENIAFFAEIHGVRDYRGRRDALLGLMQLTPFRSRLADRLSGGMKQKLALACTLVHEPEVIVLDEPTTGVDPVSRREFWRLLSRFLSDGITIFMSTPYMDEAERCSRVGLLHEGRLLALDEPGRLRAGLSGTMLEVLLAAPRSAAITLRARGGLSHTQVFGDRVHVWVAADDAGTALQTFADAAARAGVTPQAVRAIVPSLEDVYIAKLAEVSGEATSGAERISQGESR